MAVTILLDLPMGRRILKAIPDHAARLGYFYVPGPQPPPRVRFEDAELSRSTMRVLVAKPTGEYIHSANEVGVTAVEIWRAE
jgi:hypothetical protein